jgi:hypothetical protein
MVRVDIMLHSTQTCIFNNDEIRMYKNIVFVIETLSFTIFYFI